jgi:predicted SprT family Zn-dependent metalloprotease
MPVRLEHLSPRARVVAVEARHLLDIHGLRTWSFGFNRRKRALGVCLFRRRRVELSVHLVDGANDDAEIRDTLLHEIAHALTGPEHGHDDVWKEVCRRIGARPERLAHGADMPSGRWQARCRGCGVLHHRHRKPLRLHGWFCRGCGPKQGALAWRLASTS